MMISAKRWGIRAPIRNEKGPAVRRGPIRALHIGERKKLHEKVNGKVKANSARAATRRWAET